MKIRKVVIEAENGEKLTLTDPDIFMSDKKEEVLVDILAARSIQGRDSIIFG